MPLEDRPTDFSRLREPGHLDERVVASRILHRGRYLTFRIDTIERLDGSRRRREVCGHPGAVAIVALDEDDRVLLVRQFRSAAGSVLLEIPAGTLDTDPATGALEDPDLAASRELEEEAGVLAERWQRLTSFFTAPGFTTELMHLYLATGLRPAGDDGRSADTDGQLEVVRVHWRRALAAVDDGDITDAKSILGLLWLARLRGATP